jgi:hypothetical protein
MVVVQLQENQIVITIPTPSPAETLAEIQHGIIEMMKTRLASGRKGIGTGSPDCKRRLFCIGIAASNFV